MGTHQATGRILAIQGGPSQTRWDVRVHSLCLLLHFVSVILVERRQVSRTRRLDAGLSMDRGLSGSNDQTKIGRSRRCLQTLSLSHHYELYQGLPQAPQSWKGDCPNQKENGTQV